MEKRRSFGWIFPALLAGLIVAAAGLLALRLAEGQEPEEEAPAIGWEALPAEGTAEGQAEPAPAVQEETGAGPETPPAEQEGETPVLEEREWILLGDSRTIGIYWALSGDTSRREVVGEQVEGVLFACRSGEGMEWLRNTALPAVEGKIGEKSDVLILMGINDIGGAYEENAYLTFLQEKGPLWKKQGANVYYVSINPVGEGYKGKLTNERIDQWNLAIAENTPPSVTFIDTNSVLDGKLPYRDGLHFTEEGNRLVYETLRELVREAEAGQ